MTRLTVSAAILFQLVFTSYAFCSLRTTEAVEWPSVVKGVIAVNPDDQVIYYAEENVITTLDSALTVLPGTLMVNTTEMIQSLCYKDHKLFAAMGSDGIRMFKTDDNGYIQESPIGSYAPSALSASGETRDWASDIFAFKLNVGDGHVYLADTLYGIRVLTLTEDLLNAGQYILEEDGIYEKSEFPEGILGISVGSLTESSTRYAYALDAFSGVIFFDISEPVAGENIGIDETISVLGANLLYDNYARAKDVFVDDKGFLYIPHVDYVDVSAGNGAIESRLGIYRTDEAESGATLTQIGLNAIPGGYVTAMDMSEDGYAYVADTIGLQIVDVSDVAVPVIKGAYPERGEVEDPAENALGSHAVKYMAGSVYLASYANTPDNGLVKGIKKIDVSDPESPAEVGEYRKKLDVRGLCLSNEKTEDGVSIRYLFAADRGEDGGLLVFRLVDSNSLTRMAALDFLAVHDTSGPVSDVAVSGNYLFLVLAEGGLEVWDSSTPSVSFDKIAALDTEAFSDAEKLFLSGQYGYVAGGENGLIITDVASPAAPSVKSVYDTPGMAMDVYVADGYAYMADGENGLLILNVSDPLNPFPQGSFNTDGTARGVYVENGYAYVADGENGLNVIDVSAPARPVLKGKFDTPGNAGSVVVSDQIAYVADGVDGMVAVNIKKPADMEGVTFPSYQTYGVCQDIRLSSKITSLDNEKQYARYAFIADGTGGVLAVRLYENGVANQSGDIDNDVVSCFIETLNPPATDWTALFLFLSGVCFCAVALSIKKFWS
ncbi:MAG: hypothetical protein KJ737_00105 [Proteobacteria bacterium]|nr:hypothetical protein [Pseudomonadota bacterium]